jgi:hypothetical protein
MAFLADLSSRLNWLAGTP